ncbi:MAG: 3'(2'),5'-bisphosphate nucleotidase CysQ [Actinobacteria bacterium]|nr:3'(2'),5'-bisphosphate nucleotidase CysQ [Actinomycetota bacterium]
MTTTTDHTDAVRYAESAGKVLLELRDDAERPAWALGDAGDAVANRHLIGLIRADHPDDRILSEESADDRRRLDADRVWIIDPLDGTREYTEPGRADWAVHVALWERGKGLTAGAVALPALGLVLSTDPAPVVPANDGRPLRVVVSRSRAPQVAMRVAQALEADLVTLGSAGAKAMAVVRGDVDAYVHAGGQYEWDSAAPAVVAQAAGLHTSRLDGSPLEYNQSSPWLPDLIVCRPEIADRVLDVTTR